MTACVRTSRSESARGRARTSHLFEEGEYSNVFRAPRVGGMNPQFHINQDGWVGVNRLEGHHEGQLEPIAVGIREGVGEKGGEVEHVGLAVSRGPELLASRQDRCSRRACGLEDDEDCYAKQEKERRYSHWSLASRCADEGGICGHGNGQYV